LFNVTALDLAELQNFAIRGADESMRILVEGSSTGFESTVEEGCEVRINVEIGFGDFVKTELVSMSLT
jgi:hypothetical protein